MVPLRLRDVLDIFALCSPSVDATEFVAFLKTWSRDAIRDRAGQFLEHTKSPGFKGSVRQSFGYREEAAYSTQAKQAAAFASRLDRAARS